MTSAEREYLESGQPVRVVGVTCPGPGYPSGACYDAVVLVDEYELRHPTQDDRPFWALEGTCLSCGSRVYFTEHVPWSKVIIPWEAVAAATPPHKGEDDEPNVPE